MNLLKIIREKSPTSFEVTDALVKKGGIVTFLNPVSFVKVFSFKDRLDNFDYVLIDGIMLVKTLSWTGVIKTQRYSFDMTSLAVGTFQFAEKNNIKVYILGSSQENVEDFVKVIRTHYRLNIVGHRNGYFSGAGDRAQAIQSILKTGAEMVIVGLGTPIQEDFLIDLKVSGFSGLGFSCGGFIHQTTKRLMLYPRWIDKFNLRMPYRLFTEKNLYKRLPLYPLFLVYYLKELVKYHASRSHHSR